MEKCITNVPIVRYFIYCFLFVASGLKMSAQTINSLERQTIVGTNVEEQRVVSSDQQVITNFLKDNWFVLGDAGVNAFWGDYTVGNLSTRLAPQFNIGVGKWFVPGFGAKLQFTGFRSIENKSIATANTLGSNTYYDGNGNPYWRETIKWWDINAVMMFNISRIIAGYEGIGSPDLMNQFIATIGVGATHHYDITFESNDCTGLLELQYSRFFSEKKDFSLDVRLRGLFNGTIFDRITDQRIDENLSLNVGMTYYFNKRGWKRTVTNTTYYVADLEAINELNAEIARLKNAKTPVDTVIVNQELITFPYLVNFVIDKVEVVNRERVNLRVVAEMMKTTPNQKYLICGYADKYTGSVERNIWLGEHRSKNVYKVLTEEFGVPASQLVLDDKGGVDNMFYDDPQLSRSAIITRYEE